MAKNRNDEFDTLLALNGERYFVDDKGDFQLLFKVTRVATTLNRPHGIKYSLVLLDAKGERVVCFDNAHAATVGSGPAKKPSKHFDHKHIGNRIIPYNFKNAYTLLADFWKEVDKCI